jgi:hypothetical protein
VANAPIQSKGKSSIVFSLLKQADFFQWWWWHIQPIVFCRWLDDPEDEY